jgi:hypothetical protein
MAKIKVSLTETGTIVLASTKGDATTITVRRGQQITWFPTDPAAQLLLIFCSEHKPVPSTVYLGGMGDPITLTVRGPKGAEYKYAVAVITEPACPPPIHAPRCLSVTVQDPVIIIR